MTYSHAGSPYFNEFFLINFRQGIEAIEKGKKRDKKEQYSDALNFYEDGMALLLEAAATNQDDPRSNENNEHLRFKCLLIHERVEMIRNHLDVGLPLKVNNHLLNIEIKPFGLEF